jgi:hypothetical protein
LILIDILIQSINEFKTPMICTVNLWSFYWWGNCNQTNIINKPSRRGVLDTTLCDKVCQWLVAGQWFSPGTLVSSTNTTDRHDITEILLKVALSTITHKPINKMNISLQALSLMWCCSSKWNSPLKVICQPLLNFKFNINIIKSIIKIKFQVFFFNSNSEIL